MSTVNLLNINYLVRLPCESQKPSSKALVQARCRQALAAMTVTAGNGSLFTGEV